MRTLVLLAASLLAACEQPPVPPDQLLVLHRTAEGDYAVGPRAVPSLSDPHRLVGELGTGYRGGLLTPSGYRPGGPLDIRWVEHEGVAVPLDEEGLLLWSFYAALEEALEALEALGHDLAPVTPVRIAWTPTSPFDMMAFENAAWGRTERLFVLFPEALPKRVPLSANTGVVRHELGHGWFELLVLGTMDAESLPWQDASLQAILQVSALDEGFADMVATLSLDEPDFFHWSLPVEGRDVSGMAVATPDLYPDDETFPLFYDPYALGTVYASLAWDVRQATDPQTALALAVAALQDWAQEEAWEDTDRFALRLVSRAAAIAHAREPACAALAFRFPHLEEPAPCSS